MRDPSVSLRKTSSPFSKKKGSSNRWGIGENRGTIDKKRFRNKNTIKTFKMTDG
jgi:hypothetical protein